jgi:hypothetical protein
MRTGQLCSLGGFSDREGTPSACTSPFTGLGRALRCAFFGVVESPRDVDQHPKRGMVSPHVTDQ